MTTSGYFPRFNGAEDNNEGLANLKGARATTQLSRGAFSRQNVLEGLCSGLMLISSQSIFHSSHNNSQSIKSPMKLQQEIAAVHSRHPEGNGNHANCPDCFVVKERLLTVSSFKLDSLIIKSPLQTAAECANVGC